MDLKIVSRQKNPFLEREEIIFEGQSDKQTPSRKDIRERLIALTNASQDTMLVKKVENRFGSHGFTGTAFVYQTADKMKKTHRAFALKKEGLIKEEPKKEAAKQEEKK
ncbi:MAG: hypothetical protein HY392_03190 [Candidatus Diapherotrites archaeon]|nr:hypothetical protein [Candidatus Diapherotrites archaeon]